MTDTHSGPAGTAAVEGDDAVDRLLALLPLLGAALRDAEPHTRVRDRLGGAPLTPRQMSALVQLELAGSQSMSDFAAGMSVSPPAATEMAERLEERGLLVREHDQTDRRVITVRLSEAAAAEARAVLARRRRDLQRALQRFPEVPAAVVLAFMTALIQELREE